MGCPGLCILFLYNKYILEHGQIARNETESMIPYIESHSNNFRKTFDL